MAGITFTAEEIATYYTARVPHLKQSQAAQWRGPCPIHHGTQDSFSVKPQTGEWHCFSECAKGGSILQLEQVLSNKDFETSKAVVLQIVGSTGSEWLCDDLCSNGDSTTTSISEPAADNFPPDDWHEVERYPYEDFDGKVVFWVVRYLKPDGTKAFRQCKPDGNGGVTWNLEGVARIPYRLPKLVKAETVYLAEGEKDVHTLEKWDLVASCNPGGSGSSKLYTGWGKYFEGAKIVILPDNDEPGRKHAARVAAALFSVAPSVRIVELPNLPAKGDVTDWRDAGGTFEEFQKLTEAAAPLHTGTLSALRTSWGLAGEMAHQKGPSALATRRLSDIDAKPVSWLWPGRIARGKVSIIAGDPGLGKSQLTASIGAIVTTGGLWPVDQQQCKVGNVVFLNGEDDPADTLRPRLEAAGADLNRIHFVDGVDLGYGIKGHNSRRPFTLEEDLQALDRTLSELESVAAVIIDPITAYLGKIDSHKNADVRALLSPLADLAAKHNTAFICISHLTKAGGSQPLLRVSGSLAFVAAARAAFLVAADPQDKARRLLLPMKNNIGPDDKGLAFRIESASIETAYGSIPTSRVIWEPEFVSERADEIMQAGVEPQGTALSEATEWLKTALADGPESVSKLNEEAKAAGISWMTVRRAARLLTVKKDKASMNGGWQWSIPVKLLKKEDVAQQESMSTFEPVEHLPESHKYAEML